MNSRLALIFCVLVAGCPEPSTEPDPVVRPRRDGGVVDAGLRSDAGAMADAGLDGGFAADAGRPDAGAVDAGEADAGEADAGEADAGEADAGEADAGEADAGEADAGEVDAGEVDAGEVDAGEVDAGEVDAGEADAGEVDAGEVDAGEVDAGEVDAGGTDAGVADAGVPPCWPTAPQHRTIVAGSGITSVGPNVNVRTRLWFDADNNFVSEVHTFPDGRYLYGIIQAQCPNVAYFSGALILVPAPWGYDAFGNDDNGYAVRVVSLGTTSAAPSFYCPRPTGLPALAGVPGDPSSTDGQNWWVPITGLGFPWGLPPNDWEGGGALFWNPAQRDGGFVDLGGRVGSVLARSPDEAYAAVIIVDGGALQVREVSRAGPGALLSEVALPPNARCSFVAAPDHLWCLATGQFSELRDGGLVSVIQSNLENVRWYLTTRPQAPVALLERRVDAGLEYILYSERSAPQVVLTSTERIVPALGTRADGGVVFGYWEPPYPRSQNIPFVWADYCPP